MELETRVLSQAIQNVLYNIGGSLGTAESCTGGRIAESLAAIPGASNYFKGGIVSYTNELKERLLNVSHEILEEYSAVSEEVAREMVKGACETLDCTYAISATGIAGPTGGTPTIPVGTIWLAYGTQSDVHTYKLTEDFGRDRNLAIATNKALQLLLEFLQNKQLSELK